MTVNIKNDISCSFQLIEMKKKLAFQNYFGATYSKRRMWENINFDLS